MADSDARKVLVRIWLVDVDHFRDINDTLGYEVGDKVLGMLAEALQAALPPDTLLARLGEDEFGVLLDEAVETADWAGLEQMAEQVQQAVAEQISVAGRTLQLSASVGAACSSHDAANGQELILQANIALHQAKASGRNRAVIHSRNSVKRLPGGWNWCTICTPVWIWENSSRFISRSLIYRPVT